MEPATWDGAKQPPRKNNNNNNNNNNNSSSGNGNGSGEASEVKRRDSLAVRDEERVKMSGQRGQGAAGEGTLGRRRGHGQMAAASTTAAGSALKCRAEAGTRPAKGSSSITVTAKSAKVLGSNANSNSNSNFHSNASASASTNANANTINKSSSSPPQPDKTGLQDENLPSTPILDAGDLVPLPSPETLRDPHMTPPPYVHHFDSYSMVKLLEGGGFSPEQAIESMKAIRTVLGGHIQVAQRNLVSKGDAENVSNTPPPFFLATAIYVCGCVGREKKPRK